VHTLDVDWKALRGRNFRYVKASSSLLLAASRGDDASAAKLRDFRKKLAEAEIDLIVEKIELESHMPEILALGIDYGQGDLFGAARPAEIYLEAPAAAEEPEPSLLAFPDRRAVHACRRARATVRRRRRAGSPAFLTSRTAMTRSFATRGASFMTASAPFKASPMRSRRSRRRAVRS
jgi:hypothetical protein